MQMRYQGRLTDWNDARGFGFITANGGGAKVFVHISAFEDGRGRPSTNDLVSYEVVSDDKKGPRAQNVAYVGAARQRPPAQRERPRRERGGVWSKIVTALILAGIGVYYSQHYASRRTEPLPQVSPAPQFEREVPASPAAPFSCQGKHSCTEMISCEEATFYLRNCPDVRIDGDGDGIPCEDQLCGH